MVFTTPRDGWRAAVAWVAPPVDRWPGLPGLFWSRLGAPAATVSPPACDCSTGVTVCAASVGASKIASHAGDGPDGRLRASSGAWAHDVLVSEWPSSGQQGSPRWCAPGGLPARRDRCVACTLAPAEGQRWSGLGGRDARPGRPPPVCTGRGAGPGARAAATLTFGDERFGPQRGRLRRRLRLEGRTHARILAPCRDDISHSEAEDAELGATWPPWVDVRLHAALARTNH